MDPSVFAAYNGLWAAEDAVKSVTEEIRLANAALAKARADKKSKDTLRAISVTLLELADELEDANSDLADARTALAEALASFKEVFADLDADEKAVVTEAETELKAIRAEFLAFPAQILAAQAAGLKAKEALEKADDAFDSFQVLHWKYTNSYLSMSQADDDNGVVIVVQTPDGKSQQYFGPAVIRGAGDEAHPMFAVAARAGYAVSQTDDSGLLVNDEPVAEPNDEGTGSEYGIARDKQSFVTKGALDELVDEKEAPEPKFFARVKNGKILLNESKKVVDTSGDDPVTTYVLNKSKVLKHGLIVKMGLLSGKGVDNKETVSGIVGFFGEGADATGVIVGNDSTTESVLKVADATPQTNPPNNPPNNP